MYTRKRVGVLNGVLRKIKGRNKADNLELHETWVWERNRHGNRPYQKLCIYQVPQLIRSPNNSIIQNWQKNCSRMRWPEIILEVSGNIYYLQVFTKNRKNNNTTEVCSPTPLPNILKHSDQRWDFLTIWKIRFLQMYFENIWQHVWKFRFIVLHNHHWNTIRTRCLRTIKIGYDILNHLGN